MEQVERIGVSLEKQLLNEFDVLRKKKGYSNRSEAFRDMIRDQLSRQQVADPDSEVLATISLIYDHHSTKLNEKLLGLQHSHVLKTISSMHIHLDRHDCLEVIVLKGQAGEVERIAENMISLKGVKLGKVNYFSLT